jgi:hypothetical protein
MRSGAWRLTHHRSLGNRNGFDRFIDENAVACHPRVGLAGAVEARAFRHAPRGHGSALSGQKRSPQKIALDVDSRGLESTNDQSQRIQAAPTRLFFHSMREPDDAIHGDDQGQPRYRSGRDAQ